MIVIVIDLQVRFHDDGQQRWVMLPLPGLGACHRQDGPALQHVLWVLVGCHWLISTWGTSKTRRSMSVTQETNIYHQYWLRVWIVDRFSAIVEDIWLNLHIFCASFVDNWCWIKDNNHGHGNQAQWFIVYSGLPWQRSLIVMRQSWSDYPGVLCYTTTTSI